ncbi:V-type ATP synthase subunit C [Clostridium hydrogeniformans]|uniref:V-type ATP synthase subunit C n=1 Tax=Clostridium hydrogeniformans TaxID=349933 RepID=UPI0004840DD7|nr:V-type ATP synthase subunit C [Clostridium hydrogeniformans]
MDRMKYTQAVARLRVLETRLLNKIKIERMIDSSSALEALKVLQETEYGNLMGNVKRAEDYDDLLREELKRVISLAYEITPEKSFVDIMTLKYDYHNLKVLLKAKALKSDLDHLLMEMGTVPLEKLKLSIVSENLKELPDTMREAIEKAQSDFKESMDPQVIDIILDRYLYKDILRTAEDTEFDFIKDYVKNNIDFINIKTYIRLKQQKKEAKFFKEVFLQGGNLKEEVFIKNYEDSLENFIPKLSSLKSFEAVKSGLEDYLVSGRLSFFEKVTEDYLMKEAKKAKYIHFGPEPIVSYIIAKETEIKVLRIIMVGKINGLSPDAIRERLRDVYV